MEELDILKIILNYIIPTVLGGIIGILTSKIKQIKVKNQKEEKEQDDKSKAIELGVQALLRNELIRRYREYETKKEMSILDKENVEAMFKQYENLGGNGTVREMYKDLLELPIKIIK